MDVSSYKRIFFCLLFSLTVVSSALATDDGLSVLVSSESEFRFVRSFENDLSDVDLEYRADSAISFYRTVQVAIPAGASVELVSASGDGLVPLASPVVYTKPFATTSLVTVSRPVTVRGRQMVSVKISPVSPRGIYSEVEVHLRFTSSPDRAQRRSSLVSGNDPGFDRVLAATVANYEAANSWRVIPRRTSSSVRSPLADDDLYRATQWYKMSVTSTGLHQITGAQLAAAGVSLSNLHSDSIRIFNGGGLPNEIDNSRPRPSFEEIAILVNDGGDGVFGSNDRIVFYGEAVDRWFYRDGFVADYMNNPYTTRNVYWLAVSGSFTQPAVRMEQADGSIGGAIDTTVTTSRQLVHVEQDQLISTDFDGHITDFYNWYWTDSTRLTIFVPTPGAIAGDTAVVSLVGLSGGPRYIDLLLNGIGPVTESCTGRGCTDTVNNLRSGVSDLNQISLTMEPVNPSRGIPPFFDYLEIDYRGVLVPVNNRGMFGIRGSDQTAEIQIIDQFQSAPSILDISNPRRPRLITGYTREAGLVKLRYFIGADSVTNLYCGLISQAASPTGLEAVTVTDLRAANEQTDFIIVTTRALVPALDEYVAYRTTGGRVVRVVAVEDVMDNFSFGLFDPTAIRDFLKYQYESTPAPAPSAVLFVGDANYDFVDNLGTGMPNYVPSYILPGDEAYSDDNYVYFGNYGLLDSDTSYWGGGRGYDMMTARWSVRTPSEINAIVDKLIEYESSQSFGQWRSRMTLVADDEFGQFNNEVYHTTQTETLQESFIPSKYTRNKIYMWEYPFVNQEKPAVTESIIDAFNDGSLIINYVGHGNPDVWAHEHVLERGSDLPRIRNYDRLPLVFAASCAIGFFDDPRREGMAEDLLVSTNGGAMGVVSATRLVYSGPNALLNQQVYSNFFGPESLSVCEAVYAAKLQRQYPDNLPRPNSNDRAYVFMGDPYVRLAEPSLEVEFDDYPDSLVALDRTSVSGTLVDDQGQPVSLDGVLEVTVFDAHRDKMFPTDIDTARYTIDGPGIFRGSATISGGEFEFEFIPPLDVSYGRPGARISVYANCDTIDGLGVVDNIPVSQTLISSTDSTGPQIVTRIVGRSNFLSGDVVTDRDVLEIQLSDSSGINLADGIGHGIVLTIDGNSDAPVNLSSQFAYQQDDFMTGGLQYPLSSLEPGEHRLKITAWDNANNVSVTEFDVVMSVAGELAVNDLLNYPNPMAEHTTFHFELTVPTERLSLEIFTLSGRNIWSFSDYGLGADRYPNPRLTLTWDGRDSAGDRVATGVYIYKLSAVPTAGETVEKFGKVVLVN